MLEGLVLDRDGFPKAHEVFGGNRQDRTTVGEMLDSLQKRIGSKAGATVVVDRGMAYEEDLAVIRARGFHYLVAGRQPERNAWLGEFEQSDDWEEVTECLRRVILIRRNRRCASSADSKGRRFTFSV